MMSGFVDYCCCCRFSVDARLFCVVPWLGRMMFDLERMASMLVEYNFRSRTFHFDSEDFMEDAIRILREAGYNLAEANRGRRKTNANLTPEFFDHPPVLDAIRAMAAIRMESGGSFFLRSLLSSRLGLPKVSPLRGKMCVQWQRDILAHGFKPPESVFCVRTKTNGNNIRLGPRFDEFCRHVGVDPATGDPLTPAPESPEPSVAAPSPK